MDNQERLISFWEVGLRSEGLGPSKEWDAVNSTIFQKRHTAFWEIVSGLINDEPGEYDDLPQWMTEQATDSLQANN